MKTFEAQILTPDGTAYKGMAQSINLPGTEGNFQILGDHASLMSALDIGIVSIDEGAQKKSEFAISVGFVEVHDNKVTVLAEAAESPDKIDVDRALEAKKRAEERIKSASSTQNIDVHRAEVALKRAINRLELSKVLK